MQKIKDRGNKVSLFHPEIQGDFLSIKSVHKLTENNQKVNKVEKLEWGLQHCRDNPAVKSADCSGRGLGSILSTHTVAHRCLLFQRIWLLLTPTGTRLPCSKQIHTQAKHLHNKKRDIKFKKKERDTH